MPRTSSFFSHIAWTCAALALVAGSASGLRLAKAADVVETQGATLRLIRGTVANGVARLGLEIAMKPGWHTYWRYPGDSGVPPEITLAPSETAHGLTIAYPAPQRFGAPGDETIGYDGDVVLPLSVALSAPSQPTHLAISARLGICHDICLPVDETLTVPIDPTTIAAADDLALLTAAEASVPKPVAAGAPLSVVALQVDTSTMPAIAMLTLHGDDATIRDVFVEGPEGWALPLPKRLSAGPGKSQWRFALDGLPSGAKWQGVPLTLTVVGSQGSATQTVTLN